MKRLIYNSFVFVLTICLVFFVHPVLTVAQASDSAQQGHSDPQTRQVMPADSPVQVELLKNDLYRVSQDNQNDTRILPQRTQIRLRHKSFDPLAEKTTAVSDKLTVRRSNTYIVQFVTQALEAYQNEIGRLGGKLYVPFPDQAYIVGMNDNVRSQVANKSGQAQFYSKSGQAQSY